MLQLHRSALAAAFASVAILLSACATLDEPSAPSDSDSQAPVAAAFAPGNRRPRAWINSPANDTGAVQGVAISFTGGGSDPEDGQLSGASLVWTTNLNGQIGTGTSFTRSDLRVGKHTVTLTGTDADGATYKHNRTLTITAATNQPPTVSIASPANNASFAQGDAVSFVGSGSDPETGALSDSALTWTSSIDGRIGAGMAFSSAALSPGAHIITLTARDAAGLTAAVSRTLTIASSSNLAPSALIASPANQSTLTQSASVTFTGSGSDPEDGALTGASLTWRSDRDGQLGTGTSFTRTGLSLGEHLISLTATDSKGAQFTHYRVVSVTSAATSAVASVSVSLSSGSVLTGGSVTAAAVLRDASGVILTGRTVVWTSSNSTVASVNSSTGTVTALAPGTASVIATSEGVSGQASVIVSDPVVSQPSGSNEPSGMAMITDRAFNCASSTQCESDWSASGGNFSIVQDASAPRSSSNVGQMKYPAGMSGGVGPAQTWRGLGNRKTVYVSMWLKFSSNFQNHSSGVNKVNHFWINGINRIVLIGKGQGLASVIGLQQLAAPYNNGTGQNATSVHLLPNIVPTAAMTRGQWHRIELVLIANTPGVADGGVIMYQNGVKVLEYSGIMYAAAGGNGAWEQMNWNPTWGGIGDTVTSDMYMWMDHIYASGK